VTPLPTWRNAYADVAATSHQTTARMYLENVVRPALCALDQRIAELKVSDDATAAFEEADTGALREATLQAFGLSVQALWERQLRTYLIGCAKEFGRDDLTRKIEHGRWNDLQLLFKELRSVSLSDFASFDRLDLLQRIGNVCRHGDGKAARDLFDTHPEFWPPKREPLEIFGLEDVAPDDEARADAILIKLQHITDFVDAIITFWDDAEFIYVNSLSGKHPSTVKRMAEREAGFRARWRGH